MTLLASAIRYWRLSTVSLSATIEAVFLLEFAIGGEAGGNRDSKGRSLYPKGVTKLRYHVGLFCYSLES